MRNVQSTNKSHNFSIQSGALEDCIWDNAALVYLQKLFPIDFSQWYVLLLFGSNSLAPEPLSKMVF